MESTTNQILALDNSGNFKPEKPDRHQPLISALLLDAKSAATELA